MTRALVWDDDGALIACIDGMAFELESEGLSKWSERVEADNVARREKPRLRLRDEEWRALTPYYFLPELEVLSDDDCRERDRASKKFEKRRLKSRRDRKRAAIIACLRAEDVTPDFREILAELIETNAFHGPAESRAERWYDPDRFRFDYQLYREGLAVLADDAGLLLKGRRPRREEISNRARKLAMHKHNGPGERGELDPEITEKVAKRMVENPLEFPGALVGLARRILDCEIIE